MYPTMREYLVRQEQNHSLAQEAAFERWLNRVTPPSLPKESLQDRISQWFHTWRASWDRAVRCSDTAPACGLQLAG